LLLCISEPSLSVKSGLNEIGLLTKEEEEEKRGDYYD